MDFASIGTFAINVEGKAIYSAIKLVKCFKFFTDFRKSGSKKCTMQYR